MDSNHGILGAVISGSCFIIGSVIKVLNELPPIPAPILSYAQFASFAIGIAVGIITIYKHYKNKGDGK